VQKQAVRIFVCSAWAGRISYIEVCADCDTDLYRFVCRLSECAIYRKFYCVLSYVYLGCEDVYLHTLHTCTGPRTLSDSRAPLCAELGVSLFQIPDPTQSLKAKQRVSSQF